MKYFNKILLAGAIVFAICIGTLSVLFFKNIIVGSKKQHNEKNHNNSVKTENNTSQSIEDKADSESYLLELEDSTIYAYVELPNGERVLWNSTPASPTLSKIDKETLEKGISTKSFEEMCLYFESYSS